MTLALYRKYRPRTFAEVIGQEHVTEPLSQALRSGRLHHAYLFSGPRGCGKTSSARILARSLNCEQGPTPEPCGVCASCRSLTNDGVGSIDVIEIDAASHGGVDDARELREKAFFAPASSRYKIYVIDEAHMVSSAGFNALLKLVEEPPEYVKFIFATTEPEKVLGTIRSRTHHYPFRLIPPAVLRPYLQQLTEAEGIHVEPAVLPLVVRAGGGSARDSLSVLDQLIAGAGPDGVSYARAVALLGVTDVTLIDEMCDAIAAGDGAAAYSTIDRVAEAGHDPRRFASDLLERFRDLIVLQQVPDAVSKGLIDGPTDQLEAMSAQAGRLGPATLSRCADIVHNGLVEMRGTTAPRLLLELVTARMLLPGAEDSTGALLQRLERMERRLTLSADIPSVRDEPSAPAPVSTAPVAAPAPFTEDEPAAGPGRGGLSAARAAAAAASRRSPTATVKRPGAAAPAPASAAAAQVSAPPAPVSAAPAPASAPPAPVSAAPAPASVPVSAVPAPVSASPAPVAAVPAAVVPATPAARSSDAPPVAEPDHYDDEPPWDDEPEPDAYDSAPIETAASSVLERSTEAAAAAPPAVAAPPAFAEQPAVAAQPAVAEQPAVSAQPAVAAQPERRPEPRAVLPDAPEEPGAAAVEPPVGQLNAAAVREVWPEIVNAIGRQSKRLAALLSSAVVRDLEGDTVVLTFRYPKHAEMAAPEGPAVSNALYEALGGRWEIRCEVAGEAGAASVAPAPRAGSSRTAESSARGEGSGRTAESSARGEGSGRTAESSARGEGSGRTAESSARGEGSGRTAESSAGGEGSGRTAESSAGGEGSGRTAESSARGGGSGRPAESSPRGGGSGRPAESSPRGGGPGRPAESSSRNEAPAARNGRAAEPAPGAQQAHAAAARPPQSRRQETESASAGDDDWPEPVKPGGLAVAATPVVEEEEDWPEVRAIGTQSGEQSSRGADDSSALVAAPDAGEGPPLDGPPVDDGWTGDDGNGPTAPGGGEAYGARSDGAGYSGGEPAAGAAGAATGAQGTVSNGAGAPETGAAPVSAPGANGAKAGTAAGGAVAGGAVAGGAVAGGAVAGGAVAGGAVAGGAVAGGAVAGGAAAGGAVAGGNAAPGSAGAAAAARAARNAQVGSGLAAARAAASRQGTRPAAAPNQAPAASSWSDGSPAEEAPYDPEFDGPPRGGPPRGGPSRGGTSAFEGFDPGDEPLDDVIDEKTARESSEQQAMRLLQEVLGAEKIGES